MNFVVFLLVLFAVWGPVLAYPKEEQARASVSWIVSACNSGDTENNYSDGFCDGFIEGVYSGMQEWCVPGVITHGELREFIIADLKVRNSADEGTQPASEAIEEIISKRWACE